MGLISFFSLKKTSAGERLHQKRYFIKTAGSLERKDVTFFAIHFRNEQSLKKTRWLFYRFFCVADRDRLLFFCGNWFFVLRKNRWNDADLHCLTVNYIYMTNSSTKWLIRKKLKYIFFVFNIFVINIIMFHGWVKDAAKALSLSLFLLSIRIPIWWWSQLFFCFLSTSLGSTCSFVFDVLSVQLIFSLPRFLDLGISDLSWHFKSSREV